MKVRRMRRLAFALLWLAPAAEPVQAHLLAPALLEVRELPGAEMSVRWRAPSIGATAALRPVFPVPCEVVGIPRTTVDAGGARESQWRLHCTDSGFAGRAIAVAGLAGSGVEVIVRAVFGSGAEAQTLLDAAHPAWTVAPAASAGATFRSYLWLGADHLWSGPDHLLFLLGVLLLVRTPRRLLATVSAFTLGHSLTLSLAALRLIEIRQALAEVMIAATLLALACTLARLPRDSLMARRPWLMAFFFGLVHGLGFAGALAEVGLPPAQIPRALLGFNLGIEAGQLALVAAALALVWQWRRQTSLRSLPTPRWLKKTPAYVIGSLAGFWFLQRSLLAFG